MKVTPFLINWFNSLVLIILGTYAYFISDNPSVTALIPVFAGVLLLILSYWIKHKSKMAAHFAVFLTFILLFALIKPLSAALGRDDIPASVRVSLMILSCLLASIVFIKSFFDARKKI